jgi:hypothetical protein
LGGLLEGSNLEKNKTAINREYEIMYYDSGDFDERLFIDQIDQIGIVSFIFISASQVHLNFIVSIWLNANCIVGTPSKVTSQTRNYYHLRSKGAQVEPVSFANSVQ